MSESAEDSVDSATLDEIMECDMQYIKDEGGSTYAGELIYEADAELEDQEAEIEDAEIELEDAEAELEDPKAELEDPETELEDAEAELEYAEAELENAEAEQPGGAEAEVAALCPTCLSHGRAMLPLTDEAGTARAYSMLLAGFVDEEQIEEFVSYARVCWECHHLLRRTLRFQTQVLDANVLLQSCKQTDDIEINMTPLSRLTSATSVGPDRELVHEEEGRGPEKAARGRGRPRKHPLPESQEPAKKCKKRGRPAGKAGKTKTVAAGRKRATKFVTVRIGAAELGALREAERARPEYAQAQYQCDTCIKGFTFVSLLERHVRTKHSEEVGAYQCAICSVRFADEPTMRRHHRRHYLLYACGDCGYTHACLADVERHYYALHEPGRTYPCKECGEVFTQERRMRYHKETVHKPTYQCEHCSKVFNNVQVFKGHMKIHTGMPTLSCSLCAKRCRGEGGLYAHMRVAHSGERAADAYCAECRVQFRNRDGYRYHLRHSVKHATPAQLRYQCEKCSKRFLSETALRQHGQYYHLEYVCHICDKKLNSRYTYSKHMKFIHDGYVMPKKHVCDVCGKAFKTKMQLKTHMLTHTGERPHACDICGATFAQRSTLRTHKRLIHLKTPRSAAALTRSAL